MGILGTCLLYISQSSKECSASRSSQVLGNAIAIIQERLPDVRLVLQKYDTREMEWMPLSSPILYYLDFSIFYTAVNATNQQALSNLSDLKKILLGSPNLKRLNIRFDISRLHRSLNLPLEPFDRLPTLHELTVSGSVEVYDFDQKHCLLLRQCMDWSQLRHLDLGTSCPAYFFEGFGGQSSSLRSLTMGIRTDERWYSPWQHVNFPFDNLDPMTTFLESVPHLHELRLTDLCIATEVVVPVILDSQLKLRVLSYHVSSDRGRGIELNLPLAWRLALHEQLRDRCPDLEHLEIDFPLQKGKWVSSPQSPSQIHIRTFMSRSSVSKPIDYATKISGFHHLHTLKIFIELDDNASDFSSALRDTPNIGPDFLLPFFDEWHARAVSDELFKAFFASDPYAWLRELEVCFLRSEYTKWRFRYRRLERDDEKSVLEGGYECEMIPWTERTH